MCCLVQIKVPLNRLKVESIPCLILLHKNSYMYICIFLHLRFLFDKKCYYLPEKLEIGGYDDEKCKDVWISDFGRCISPGRYGSGKLLLLLCPSSARSTRKFEKIL